MNSIIDFWSVVGLSALPFTELRFSLPFALTVYDLEPLNAYGAAVIGNTLPVIVLLTLLPSTVSFLRKKSSLFDSFFSWWFARTIHSYRDKLKRWGMFALFIFVAIPFPLTGAWTGSVASYLFNLPRFQAFIYIFAGILVSGALVLLGTLGILSLGAL